MNPLESEYLASQEQSFRNERINTPDRRLEGADGEVPKEDRPNIIETGKQVFNILRQHDIEWGVRINEAAGSALDSLPAEESERQKAAMISAIMGAVGSVALAKLFGDSETPRIILEAALRGAAMKAGMFALGQAREQKRGAT